MQVALFPVATADQAMAETWDGQRLTYYTCTLGDLAQSLPRVERRPFAISASEVVQGSLLSSDKQPGPAGNPYHDVIVRLADEQINTEIPLGIVSKRYRLVQHYELLEGVVAGLKLSRVPWEERSFRRA